MWHNSNQALHFSDSFTYKGYAVSVLENAYWRITLLPERGAEIVSALYKPHAFEVLCHLPERFAPRTGFPPAATPAGSAFVNGFAGGWQSVFPNGGSACVHDGVAHEMMGEAWRLEWALAGVEDDGQTLTVTYRSATTQTPFELIRSVTLRADDPVFDVADQVRNVSRQRMDFMWGQHLTFDADRYGNGDWGLDVSATQVETNVSSSLNPDAPQPGQRRNRFPRDGHLDWPNAMMTDGSTLNLSQLPESGSTENCDMLYLHGCDGWFALMNRSEEHGVFMRWPASQLPHLWYWQNFHGSYGYPWFGTANIFALEPFTSYPAYGVAEATHRGAQSSLGPGASTTFPISFGWVEGRSKIGCADDLPTPRKFISL